jgi:soluble lytic murein transglycosylase-like protein
VGTLRSRWRTGLVAAGLALAAPCAVAAIEDAAVEDTLRAFLRKQALAYENGEGVARDPAQAAALYCKAARLGDAAAQFNLGWMYANGRGVERSDATAAFFFHAAAEQGSEQALRMLASVGGPPNGVPDCMRDPDPPAPRAASKGRTPLPPWRSNAPPHLIKLVGELAPGYQVEPRLVLSIMEAESNFDPAARSPKNAQGLMQLLPDTQARFGVSRPYDPRQNIRGGIAYLRWLLAYFEGDIELVAAAYNAGEGTVVRYRGVPPYAETRAYVAKVLRLTGMVSHPFDRTVVEPAAPALRGVRLAR